MIPPDTLRIRVGKLLEEKGIDQTADLLQLKVETIYRLANGDQVKPVSINLAEARLKELRR
jgi:hypothetical protein